MRVVTYDYLMGIPSWAEREHSHIGERDQYHEFTAEPNTILWLDKDLAQYLLSFTKWRVHLPGQRQSYTPILERGKERKDETQRSPARRTRRDIAARINRMWG